MSGSDNIVMHKAIMKHLKDFGRRVVYSRALFAASELPVIVAFKIADKLDRQSLWCLFFVLVKFQLAIGFRSGEFSYLTGHASSKSKLSIMEQRVITAADHIKLNVDNNRQSDGVLFVTSFIARTGGHTRLLQTYLQHMEGGKLLISGDAFFFGRQKFLQDQESLISELFQDAKNHVTLNRASSLNPCTQIKLLVRHLHELQPQSIILFNEPSDLALLVSVLIYTNMDKNVKVYYYHHADDYLPFLGSAFHEHIDLDSNQDAKCSDISNRSLIRISVKNRIGCHIDKAKKPFTVFTFAPVVKIKPDRGFAKLISLITNEGIHIIIATRPHERVELKCILRAYKARLSLIRVDDDCFDITKYDSVIHAYLDTFPRGGGMSIVDGLSLGIPVVINGGDGNQVFRDSVLNDFIFPGREQMFSYLMRLKEHPQYYEEQSQRAKRVFIENFDAQTMVSTFRSIIGKSEGL